MHKTFLLSNSLNRSICFLLQVPSHLENSKFHHHQSQNQQVKQYFTLGSKLASSAGQGHAIPHPHTPGQALATVPIMRNGHMAPVSDGSNPNSPVTLLTMTNHDSEVSKNKLKLKECVVLTGKELQSLSRQVTSPGNHRL